MLIDTKAELALKSDAFLQLDSASVISLTVLYCSMMSNFNPHQARAAKFWLYRVEKASK